MLIKRAYEIISNLHRSFFELNHFHLLNMKHPRLCSSRPVLVQPVEGSNLLFVLDPDKKGRCVESSKLARSDPTCQDHVIPMLINRGGELTITYSV